MKQRAVVLLSGGLDSATVLAIAQSEGFACHALTIDYGQRHRAELGAARRVAVALGAVEHRVVNLDMTWIGGSALTDTSIAVPESRSSGQSRSAGVPITYVPARNTVFLSLAMAWAEKLGAQTLFIGANAVDFSGYPDCRPEFIAAFTALANLATSTGASGAQWQVRAPLMTMQKAQIIQSGIALGVDYGATLSCYQPDEDARSCGLCDACAIRMQGFAAAGVADPTHYRD